MVSSDQRLALGGEEGEGVVVCGRGVEAVEVEVEIWRRVRVLALVLLAESEERMRSGVRLGKLSLRVRVVVEMEAFRGR